MQPVILPVLDKDLLAECRVEAYRASGKGGQHINVTDSAIRLTHLPTGLVVTSQKERSQYLNKQDCLDKLRKKVEKLNYRKPKRVATRPTLASKRETKAAKTKTAEKKRLRRPPSPE